MVLFFSDLDWKLFLGSSLCHLSITLLTEGFIAKEGKLDYEIRNSMRCRFIDWKFCDKSSFSFLKLLKKKHCCGSIRYVTLMEIGLMLMKHVFKSKKSDKQVWIVVLS